MGRSDPQAGDDFDSGFEARRRLASLADADAVSAELESIYGVEPKSSGVVHVTAVWQRGDGDLVTLRTAAGAPRVAHDALVLGLARARADAILTTAEVLRCEPGLRHDLSGPGELPQPPTRG